MDNPVGQDSVEMARRDSVRGMPRVRRGSDAERAPPTDPQAGRSVSSVELFRGAGELAIVHGGRTYRLRITRNDKLILNA